MYDVMNNNNVQMVIITRSYNLSLISDPPQAHLPHQCILIYLFQNVQCYFEDDFLPTNVYLLEELMYGHKLNGPSIIIDKNR